MRAAVVEFIVVLVLTLLCAAQTSRVAGAVQGTAVDQTDSAIVAGTATMRNPATGLSRTTSMNSDGSFRIGELPVGLYELHIESPGFSLYVNKAVPISIGRVTQVAVRLAPATVRQQVIVTEQPLPIDPTETTDATTVGRERIEESPVVSRNYLEFVLLAPQLTRSNVQGTTGGKNA